MVESLARITQVYELSMIQIRADLSQAGAAIAAATGVAIPDQTSVTTAGSRSLCWMSPDELLLVVPHVDLAPLLAALTQALADQHALVVDVSDMRAAFAIQGERALQVMMKISPCDLAAMPANGIRRTRASQVACGIWRCEDGFMLVGFRSVGEYLRKLLQVASRPGTGLDPR